MSATSSKETQRVGLNPHGPVSSDPLAKKNTLAILGERLSGVTSFLAQRNDYDEQLAEEARDHFLAFCSLRLITEETLVPSQRVDDFWHEFMLDPVAYSDFCTRHFGFVLPHDRRTLPYEEEVAQFRRTRQLLDESFTNVGKAWDESGCSCGCHCSPPGLGVSA